MDAKADREFDVLLSFARTERDYARAIHEIASANGLRSFLDEEFQHEIWGKNLFEYLDATYRERGLYVLALISAEYRKRGYTRVERRAAFDRMVHEAGEYLLPVKVDDSWIEGLPRSTAYLDLRTHGVLGVCELLVRKVLGISRKLVVPPSVAIPRVPLGSLPANQLASYLLELCARPQVTVFGTLIYDENSVALRKLVKDRDYWDALDKASGPHFEVFAIRDTESYATEPVISLMTATPLSRSRSRGYYFSKLLNDYFGKEKTTLVYPSFLLFLAESGRIKHCRLVPFHQASIEETFIWLSAMFAEIAGGIEEVGGPTTSLDVLWQHLKENLLRNDYTLYIQKPPKHVAEAVSGLVAYVECDAATQ